MSPWGKTRGSKVCFILSTNSKPTQKHVAGVEGCCDQHGDDRSERTREPRATLGQRQNGDCRRRGRADNISRGKASTKKFGRSPQAIDDCRSESEEIASTVSFCV